MAKSNWVLKICNDGDFTNFPEQPTPVLYKSVVKFLFLYIQLECLLLEFGSVACPFTATFKMSLPLSSLQFLTLSEDSSWIFLSLLFSRLNKPSVVNFLRVLVARSSSLQSLRSMWMATLLSNTLTASPHGITQGSLCSVIQVTGEGVKLYQPHLNFEKCHLELVACWLLLFKPSSPVSSSLVL